ncbi:MAG: hypothetical protein LBM62_04600 [Mediterranea sp.]|jgi:hypothetical protein|nr:hypothetical protein [Mediterranea sp.]
MKQRMLLLAIVSLFSISSYAITITTSCGYQEEVDAKRFRNTEELLAYTMALEAAKCTEEQDPSLPPEG